MIPFTLVCLILKQNIQYAKTEKPQLLTARCKQRTKALLNSPGIRKLLQETIPQRGIVACSFLRYF